MDSRSIAEVAAAVVAFLAPYLAEGGRAAAQEGGKALMEALEHKLGEREAARDALKNMQTNPQDEDIQAALRVQLKKALAADQEFLAELTRLLEKAEAETSPVTDRRIVIADDHSVAVGGDLKGNVTIKG